jgi:hypothetical protein
LEFDLIIADLVAAGKGESGKDMSFVCIENKRFFGYNGLTG